MQKSLKGLLRSLLHQILKDQPHLISSIFHKVLELPDSQFDFENFATEVELMRALRKSLDQTSRPSNYVFFIDGLNEYKASERELVALVGLFQSLAALPRVKFVLSSRPLPVFAHGFEKGPSLELRKLTNKDISKFVRDKLYKSLVHRYGSENPDGVESLLTYIVDQAEGVFRWVVLIVEAVLKGIRDWSTLYELDKEVRKLPVELIPFYCYMWDSIKNEEYRVEASKLFRLVRYATLDDNAYVKDLRRAVTLFFTTTEDPNQQVFARPIQPLDLARQTNIVKIVEGRLRSCPKRKGAGTFCSDYFPNTFYSIDLLCLCGGSVAEARLLLSRPGQQGRIPLW